MADYYTMSCFELRLKRSEFALLDEVATICHAVRMQTEIDTPTQAFQDAFGVGAGPFPEGEYDGLIDFLSLFADQDFPELGFALNPGKTDPQPDYIKIIIESDNLDINLTANLLRKCCPSALPITFGYANTCSRMRVDAFSGGIVEISADRINYYASGSSPKTHVIAHVAENDSDEGLVFWGSNGWGDLETAETFSENDVATLTLPLVGSPKARWMKLPRI